MKNFKFFPVLFLALLLAACSDIDGLNDYNAVFSFEITEHKGTDGEIVIGEPVMAGNTIRAVLEAAGVRDIVAKSLGSSNHANVVKATLQALASLRTSDQVLADRGKKKEKAI